MTFFAVHSTRHTTLPATVALRLATGCAVCPSGNVAVLTDTATTENVNAIFDVR